MITTLNNLPLIILPDGRAVLYDRLWILRSLGKAALKAGKQAWWPAEHVVESVTEFLRRECETRALESLTLENAVRKVLSVIGYQEISDVYKLGHPPAQISLEDLARSAELELSFFPMLSTEIKRITNSGVSHFELLGLERCVKMLRSRRIWCKTCSILRDEIIAFVRSELNLSAKSDISLSVT